MASMEYSGASAFPKPANLTSTYEYTPHELGEFIIFLHRWKLKIRDPPHPPDMVESLGLETNGF